MFIERANLRPVHLVIQRTFTLSQPMTVLLCLAMCLTGCGYFRNVGYSASEIVQGQVGYGKGAAVDVYASFLEGTGVGCYRLKWVGYGPCYVPHCRCHLSSLDQDYMSAVLAWKCTDTSPTAGELMLVNFVTGPCPTFPLRANWRGNMDSTEQQVVDNGQLLKESLWRSLDFGFTFVPACTRVRVDFSPGKMVNFVGSIFFLDLEGSSVCRPNGDAAKIGVKPSSNEDEEARETATREGRRESPGG